MHRAAPISRTSSRAHLYAAAPQLHRGITKVQLRVCLTVAPAIVHLARPAIVRRRGQASILPGSVKEDSVARNANITHKGILLQE